MNDTKTSDHYLSLLHEYMNKIVPEFQLDDSTINKHRIEIYNFIKDFTILKTGKVEINLAVVGEFKTGKSSFINSLIGEELVPVGQEPMTLIPCKFIYKDEMEIWLEYKNGEKEQINIEQFNEIKHNNNGKNNELIDNIYKTIFGYPNPFFQYVHLIDTPGFESATNEGDDKRTMEIIKEEADALLWVIDVNSGMKNSDINIIKELKQQSKEIKIFIVLNKMDTKCHSNCDKFVRKIKESIDNSLSPAVYESIIPYSAKQILKIRRNSRILQKELNRINELIYKNGIREIEIKLDESNNIILKTENKTSKIGKNDSNDIWVEYNEILEEHLKKIIELQKDLLVYKIPGKYFILRKNIERYCEKSIITIDEEIKELRRIENYINSKINSWIKDMEKSKSIFIDLNEDQAIYLYEKGMESILENTNIHYNVEQILELLNKSKISIYSEDLKGILAETINSFNELIEIMDEDISEEELFLIGVNVLLSECVFVYKELWNRVDSEINNQIMSKKNRKESIEKFKKELGQ